MRKFALVLSCKSKSGYKWIRNKFSKRFPALRTIRAWQKNSNSNISSGFCDQTIKTLTELSEDERKKNKELYVSLCFDEIAIRKHIQWVHSQKFFSGLITYGERNDYDIPVANNAIFFLITLVESKQSLVLGYFLIKSLDATEKSQLLRMTIEKIHNTGAYLLTIAFDGLPTNFTVCKMLGASFDINNFKPFIIIFGRKIPVVLDPPHTIKLIRNCLEAKTTLIDGDNNEISWTYFEKLVSKRANLVSHKMTRKHIDFHTNKMNVKIAAQTLSLSVAKSMEALLCSGDSQFGNSEATITFTKNFNKGFDIFNAKHVDSNNLFKRGLNEKNADKIFEFLEYFKKYITLLKLNGANILNTM